MVSRLLPAVATMWTLAISGCSHPRCVEEDGVNCPILPGDECALPRTVQCGLDTANNHFVLMSCDDGHWTAHKDCPGNGCGVVNPPDGNSYNGGATVECGSGSFAVELGDCALNEYDHPQYPPTCSLTDPAVELTCDPRGSVWRRADGGTACNR